MQYYKYFLTDRAQEEISGTQIQSLVLGSLLFVCLMDRTECAVHDSSTEFGRHAYHVLLHLDPHSTLIFCKKSGICWPTNAGVKAHISCSGLPLTSSVALLVEGDSNPFLKILFFQGR